VVVSQSCTNLGSVAKRLKESDLVVTQHYNILSDDFAFSKKVISRVMFLKD
jgi:hypothetical protein